MGYVLIGTQASQFTGKARSYLRWKGVDFAERAATPELYRDIIEPRIGYPVIPILLTPNGGAIQDTREIIDHVEREEGGPALQPSGAVQKLAGLLIELYADEWLSIAAAHYRWTYNEQWSVAELGRTASPEATTQEQLGIGRILADRSREMAGKLGASEETGSGVEAHYEGFLADFSAHLRKLPYLFGQRPGIADFALFGPLYGPLYRDPASGELMRKQAPVVAEWVERVNRRDPDAGEFLSGDEVPETLQPILKRQMMEQAPDLAESVRVFGEWCAVQPQGARVPRTLGTHEFTIGGREGERSVFASALWRLQRAVDHYQSLTGSERSRADALLDAVGGRGLAEMRLPRRLERREYRLVVV